MSAELSVVEQKYLALLAVIADGRAVAEVAEQWGVAAVGSCLAAEDSQAERRGRVAPTGRG